MPMKRRHLPVIYSEADPRQLRVQVKGLMLRQSVRRCRKR